MTDISVGIDLATKQGNRRLQATVYFLAVQKTERNLAFRKYYEKKLGEGKNGQQALICISRKLINFIYGMLKNGTEYQMPEIEDSDEKS